MAAAAAVAWRTPILADSAWQLWLARRSLHGVVAYRDLSDMNPPLAHWVLLPPALLVEFAHWPQWLAFNGFVVAWCGTSIGLLAAIWRRWERAPCPVGMPESIASIALFILPGPFFGQREHLMIAAMLPWLVTVAVWRSGQGVPSRLAWPAAIGVALAIALKPFFIGWWLMAPILSENSRRTLAFWLVPSFGIGYLVAVSRTGFPAYAMQWSAVYWRYAHRPLWFVAFGNPFALLAVGAAALTARNARESPLTATLWVATIAAWLGAAAQMKALPYHYYPCLVLSLALLAASRRSARRVVVAPVATAWTLYVAWFLTAGTARPHRLAIALDQAAGADSAMVLAPAADHAWLLTSNFSRPWLSNQYDLWWLAISQGGDTVPGLPRWRVQNEILRRDLLPASLPPVLLLGRQGIDVRNYLQRDTAWARALDPYVRTELIAGYEVWRDSTRPSAAVRQPRMVQQPR